jgi:hypothetical protein
MNKKQFLILVVLVTVLGLWGLSRWRGQTSSYNGGGNAVGQKLLGEFDVNAVVQLAIKQGTNELLLAKKDDVWRVAQRNELPGELLRDQFAAAEVEKSQSSADRTRRTVTASSLGTRRRRLERANRGGVPRCDRQSFQDIDARQKAHAERWAEFPDG